MNCMLLPPPEPCSARLLVPTLSVPDTKPEMYGVRSNRGNHVWSGLATAGWIRVPPSHSILLLLQTYHAFQHGMVFPRYNREAYMFNS